MDNTNLWLLLAWLLAPGLAWMFWGTGAGIVTTVLVTVLLFFYYDMHS